MGLLETAVPTIVICTRDRDRATEFYRDVLGLSFAYADQFASVFSTGGITLRISLVTDFIPHGHTILGFRVPDVEQLVRGLRTKGIVFNIYPGFNQTDLGILVLPGSVHVAWFNDPD